MKKFFVFLFCLCSASVAFGADSLNDISANVPPSYDDDDQLDDEDLIYEDDDEDVDDDDNEDEDNQMNEQGDVSN